MMLLGLALMLGACTGQESSNGKLEEAGTPASKARTIKHLKGEMKLDHTPVKIAVLDVQYIDQMLALGKQPIGSVIATADALLFPEYLSDKLGNIQVLGTREVPNLEAILALDPDLIIANEDHEKIYDALIKIAPVLMIERTEDWRTTVLTFGQILDKEQEAQQILLGYEKKISELKAALTTKMGEQTVGLIRPRDNIIRIHTTAHRTAEILYNDLGLAAPKMAVDAKKTSDSIALEVMPEFNADHLFLLQDDSNFMLTNEFQKTSIWKGLKAVQSNRIYSVNTTLWIGYYGPIAINLVLDQIAKSLL